MICKISSSNYRAYAINSKRICRSSHEIIHMRGLLYLKLGLLKIYIVNLVLRDSNVSAVRLSVLERIFVGIPT